MKQKEKIYSASLIILMSLSMIPLVIISKYNHPSADDFNYSIVTFHEWNVSHSIWKLLCAAIDTSKQFYDNWQGLYSSAFFLSLQPAIFGEKYYALTGVIMLLIIVFSTCYFFCYIAKKVIGISFLDGITVGFAASFLMIQWMPSCVQGLYWYNGAMNYGLFHSILLFFICACINLHKRYDKKKIIGSFLICCLLGFLLEGGNHVTAFLGILFVFFALLVEIILRVRVKAIYFGSLLLMLIICFLFNILSPGTKIRSEGLNEYRMDFMISLKTAVSGGVKNINSWIDLAPIVVILLVMPIFLKAIMKLCDNTKFTFSNPFYVFVCSIAWVCAMYCPPLYAMGYMGEGRLHNVVYYHFVILLFINVFYCSGWVVRKLGIKYSVNQSYINIKWIGCMVVLCIGLYIAKWDSTWSAEAIMKLKLGEAQWYSQQAYDRSEVLLSSKGQDVVVKEYSVRPEILFFDDITEEPEDWRNVSVKSFYELNSIIIER